MANPNKFTAKEVLNKVLLDSSGNAVTANSVTSQEALNSVLDTTNNRLNMSLAGGTISGDVTISGDLTVNGDSVANVSEVVNGDMTITSSASNHPILTLENTNTDDSPAFLTFKKSNSGDANNGDEVGQFKYQAFNNAGTPELTTYADHFVSTEDVSNGSEDGSMTFRTMKSGTLTQTMQLKSGDATFSGAVTVSGGNVNVDGANRKILIGESGLSGGAFGHIGWNDSSDHLFIGHSYGSAFNEDIVISSGGNVTFSNKVKIDQDSNNFALEIDSENTTANAILVECDALTSNGIARFYSNSSNSSSRNLIQIVNNNASATGAVPLKIEQNSTGLVADLHGASGSTLRLTSANTNITGAELVGKVEAFISDASGNLPGVAGSIDWTTNGSIDGSSTKGTNFTLKTYLESSGLVTNMVLDGNSRISLSNNDSGTSNTIFGKNVGTIDSGSNYNVFIGEDVATENTLDDATQNTAVGYRSGHSLTSGDSNSFYGRQTGLEMQDGSENTFIGMNAGATSVSGTKMVAVGVGAIGTANVTTAATGTVAIGYDSLKVLTSGAGNTAVGFEALKSVDTGGENVAMGSEAGLDLTSGAESVLIGSRAGYNLTTTNGNVAIGRYSLYNSTDAIDCVAIGRQTMFLGSATQTGTVAIGKNSLTNLSSGSGNTAVGFGTAEQTTTGGGNTVLGYQALTGDADGDGSDNTVLGHKAMLSAVSPSKNVAIGDSAMRVMNGTANGIADCVAIGANAFFGDATNTTTGTNGTVAVGKDSLKSLTTGIKSVAVGYQSQANQTTGNRNTTLGYGTMYTADGGEDFNIAIGSEAGYFINNDASHDNVIIGKNALQGGNGEIIGCVAIGSNAMDAVSNNNQTGTIAIGTDALGGLTSGTANVAVGHEALKALTTGASNHAFGYQSQFANVDGVANVSFGRGTLGSNVSGNFNTAFGHQALETFNSDIDGKNTAVGINAGQAVTTGRENTILGAFTGDAMTAGVQNVIVGADSDISAVDAGNEIVLGYGVTGKGSNKATIGNADITDVYMASDSGATVHTAGIQFPSSQAASGGANVLDDYEEGEHTVTGTDAGGGTFTLNSSYNKLTYTKIGRQVTVSGELALNDLSSTVSGELRFTLPFALLDHSTGGDRFLGVVQTRNVNHTANAVSLVAKAVNATQYFYIVEITDDGIESSVTGAMCSTNDEVTVTLTYFTS